MDCTSTGERRPISREEVWEKEEGATTDFQPERETGVNSLKHSFARVVNRCPIRSSRSKKSAARDSSAGLDGVFGTDY